MTQPKFEIGQTVFKHTGDYTGPGVVRGISTLANGKLRYLVGHRIEGGDGEFLHVYAQGNLREAGGDAELPTAQDVRGILNPAVPDDGVA